MNEEERKKLEEESRFTVRNREQKALVTLGGIAITQSGKVTKSELFRFIGHDLDDYEAIQMTPQEAKRIDCHLRKLSTGAAALVPLYCGGPNICPFASRCPLAQLGKAPIGKSCLIEVQLIKEFTIRYLEEYDVDPNNLTELTFINELAEIEIRLMRINMSLAKPENAEMTIDQVMGISPQGRPILQKQISPLMDIREKLLARKSRIIKLMVGDRQEKYKKDAALKTKNDQDASSRQAALFAKLSELQRQLEGKIPTKPVLSPEDIIDAEFEEPTKENG